MVQQNTDKKATLLSARDTQAMDSVQGFASMRWRLEVTLVVCRDPTRPTLAAISSRLMWRADRSRRSPQCLIVVWVHPVRAHAGWPFIPHLSLFPQHHTWGGLPSMSHYDGLI